MVLSIFLLQDYEKALIGIALLFFVIYVFLVIHSIVALKSFKNTLNSYEASIKMCIVETITLIRELSKISDIKINDDVNEKLDKIESFAAQDIIKGYYKQVFMIFSELYNSTKGNIQDSERLREIENNFLQQKELDKLYQNALFCHNADLIGYNYWVKNILVKPFTLLFKFKKRESIY